MIEEIVYTSAPRGLRPGSRGFCTVASTPGMASSLATFLESLSGYRQIAGDQHVTTNPVVYSNLRAVVGGRQLQILSRIADAGLDYSGRTNKLAHHVAVEARGLPPAGPAAIQSQGDFHVAAWSGEPRVLAIRQSLPAQATVPTPCEAWRRVTGDAGWGGAIGERLEQDGAGDLWLVCPSELDSLELLAESLAIMPPELRWKTTYTTYFTILPPGIDCRVKFVVDGTPEAAKVRSRYELNAIDLCKPLPAAGGSKWSIAARTGTPVQAPKVTAPRVATASSKPAIVLEAPSSEVDLALMASELPPALPSTSASGYGVRRKKRAPSSMLVLSAVASVFFLTGSAGVIWWLSNPPVEPVAKETNHDNPSSKKGDEIAAEKKDKKEAEGKNDTSKSPADNVNESHASDSTEKPAPSEQPPEPKVEETLPPIPLETPPAPFFSSDRIYFTACEGKRRLTIGDPESVRAILLKPNGDSTALVGETLFRKGVLKIGLPAQKPANAKKLLSLKYDGEALDCDPDKALIDKQGVKQQNYATVRSSLLVLYNLKDPKEQCFVYFDSPKKGQTIKAALDGFGAGEQFLAFPKNATPVVELRVTKNESDESPLEGLEVSANFGVITVNVGTMAPESKSDELRLLQFTTTVASSPTSAEVLVGWYETLKQFDDEADRQGLVEKDYWKCQELINQHPHIEPSKQKIAVKLAGVGSKAGVFTEVDKLVDKMAKKMVGAPPNLPLRDLEAVARGITINYRVTCPLSPVGFPKGFSPENQSLFQNHSVILSSTYPEDFPAN